MAGVCVQKVLCVQKVSSACFFLSHHRPANAHPLGNECIERLEFEIQEKVEAGMSPNSEEVCFVAVTCDIVLILFCCTGAANEEDHSHDEAAY